jgi:hypothetical protein
VTPVVGENASPSNCGLPRQWYPPRYERQPGGDTVGAQAGTVPTVRFADACTRGLVADDERVRAAIGPIPGGWRTIERYVVIPSTRSPQILAPAAAPGAAAAAITQFSNGAPARKRIVAVAGAAALRAGVAQRLLRGRATISVAPGVGDRDLPDLVLSHHLAHALELRRAHLAVRVGAARPNGKPVVQVSVPGGHVVAYAKIGWNDLTRTLVAAEAAALRDLAAARPASFATPALLHAGDWDGLAVTAVAPAIGGRPHVSPEPPPAATRELALGAAVERGPLADSRWWQTLLTRIAAAGGEGQRAAAGRIAETFGGRELAFGRGHGDWTPWNMAEVGGRLVVWDWERSATRGPVGVDAVHYCLLVALNARGLARDKAVADTLERAPRVLGQLDVAVADARLIVALELLEMSVRFAEARAAGVTGLRDRFGIPLAALLDGRYDGGEAS